MFNIAEREGARRQRGPCLKGRLSITSQGTPIPGVAQRVDIIWASLLTSLWGRERHFTSQPMIFTWCGSHPYGGGALKIVPALTMMAAMPPPPSVAWTISRSCGLLSFQNKIGVCFNCECKKLLALDMLDGSIQPGRVKAAAIRPYHLGHSVLECQPDSWCWGERGF